MSSVSQYRHLATTCRQRGANRQPSAAAWDLDLQLPPPGPDGAGDVALGDLVAVSDLDVRYNMGYRRGWVTVGIAVHGASPLPGHGPGITPLLTGPAAALPVNADAAGHV